MIEVDDEHSEARLVAGRISQMLENGSAAREVAVFYRTNAQSRVLEDLLVRMSIPYQVIGGPRFYERAEIKDAMAYLQLLDNLANEVALRRIINTPKRGIGSTTVEKIATLASTAGTSMWETIATMEPGTLPTAAERALFGFRGLIDDLRERVADCGVGDAAEAVIERSGMVEAFEAERTVESQGRVENLQELVGVAREYEAQSEDPSLTGFLQEVSLVADADSVELDERGKVTLMTLHNAKGLEFENVFVTGMEQNLFPHARSIEENNLEEERRLFYVAITRARQRLTLAYARQRTIFGNRGYALPSQFLDEIPADLTRRERAGGEYGRPMSSSYGGRSGSGSGSRDWGGRAAVARGGYGSSTTPAGSTGVAPREDVPDAVRRRRRAAQGARRRGRPRRPGRRPGRRAIRGGRLGAAPAPGLRAARPHRLREPRAVPLPCRSRGRLAQLGEHQLDKLGVTGSSPVSPTSQKAPHSAGFSRFRGSASRPVFTPNRHLNVTARGRRRRPASPTRRSPRRAPGARRSGRSSARWYP